MFCQPGRIFLWRTDFCLHRVIDSLGSCLWSFWTLWSLQCGTGHPQTVLAHRLVVGICVISDRIGLCSCRWKGLRRSTLSISCAWLGFQLCLGGRSCRCFYWVSECFLWSNRIGFSPSCGRCEPECSTCRERIRDDGLAVFENLSGRAADKARKEFTRIYRIGFIAEKLPKTRDVPPRRPMPNRQPSLQSHGKSWQQTGKNVYRDDRKHLQNTLQRSQSLPQALKAIEMTPRSQNTSGN